MEFVCLTFFKIKNLSNLFNCWKKNKLWAATTEKSASHTVSIYKNYMTSIVFRKKQNLKKKMNPKILIRKMVFQQTLQG